MTDNSSIRIFHDFLSDSSRFSLEFSSRVSSLSRSDCCVLSAAWYNDVGTIVFAAPSRLQISQTKSCVTNWATPIQIMEVLFDERANSFISFFQRSVRWTQWQEGPPSRIKRDYAHSFQLIVNSYVLTARVHRCARVRLRKRTCLIAQPTTTIYNRDRELYRDVGHMILTSAYTHNDFFSPVIAIHRYGVPVRCLRVWLPSQIKLPVK